MELQHLRALREVAMRGSISAAADALGYTQPALSRQLALLERDVGQQLIVRTSRGASLTGAGQTLHRHAEGILGAVARARSELAVIAALERGTVRLAIARGLVAPLMPLASAWLERWAPELAVELEVVDAVVAAELLDGGAVDIAVTDRRAFDVVDATFPMRVLAEDPLLCVLSPRHRLADAEAVALADLAAEPWVTSSPANCPAFRTVLQAAEREGRTLQVRFTVGDHEAGIGLVSARQAVMMLPGLAIRFERSDVVVRPFQPALTRTVIAAWGPQSDRGDVVARAFAHAAARVLGAARAPAVAAQA